MASGFVFSCYENARVFTGMVNFHWGEDVVKRQNSFAFFEIVELEKGEVVLRRKNENANPLVRIQFSDEAKLYLGASVPEIACAMIDGGIEKVGTLLKYQRSEEGRQTMH
jgi:hypothetical protein